MSQNINKKIQKKPFGGGLKICNLKSGRFQKAGAEKPSSLVSSIIESLEYGINMAASDKELVRRA